jgi:hypothetical protein
MLRSAGWLALLATGCNFGSSTGASPDGGPGAQLDAALTETAADTGAVPDSATACVPGGTPVIHSDDITADTTWASGIHLVPSSLRITSGARLTVAGCTEVRLGPAASITVEPTAAGLDAVGTALEPIRFVQQQAGTPWGTLDVTAPATAHLAYATIDGGGTGPHDTAPLAGASLHARGTDPALPVVLELEHVTVSHSGGLGILMQAARFDPASTDLTVTGSGWYPVYLGIGSAGDLPIGAYTGNAVDQILLQSYGVAAYDDSGPLLADVTLHDPGVPYLVGTEPTSLVIGDTNQTSPSETLTLQAGVTMLFPPKTGSASGAIDVRAAFTPTGYVPQGALVLAGTAASPVVLGSAAATPAAADWVGIYFSNVVSPATSITHAHILNAGADSSTIGICGSLPGAPNGAATCAIVLSLDAPPPPFLSSSVLELTPCGVYRGWKQAADVDFVTTNQFVSIPGCTQTSLPASDGSCVACATSP